MHSYKIRVLGKETQMHQNYKMQVCLTVSRPLSWECLVTWDSITCGFSLWNTFTYSDYPSGIFCKMYLWSCWWSQSQIRQSSWYEDGYMRNAGTVPSISSWVGDPRKTLWHQRLSVSYMILLCAIMLQRIVRWAPNIKSRVALFWLLKQLPLSGFVFTALSKGFHFPFDVRFTSWPPTSDFKTSYSSSIWIDSWQ